MSKLQPALMKSATFRRRMRGVKARADWETVMAQRKREIALFDALPLRLDHEPLNLGEGGLDVSADIVTVVTSDRIQGQLARFIQKLQRIFGTSSRDGDESHYQPVVGKTTQRLFQQRFVRCCDALVQSPNHFLKLGHALLKGLHRLLSIGLRCGEDAESPAGANPPPATKRSAGE